MQSSSILAVLQILEYHVVPNVVLFAENFTNGQVLPTVIQDTLTVGAQYTRIPKHRMSCRI